MLFLRRYGEAARVRDAYAERASKYKIQVHIHSAKSMPAVVLRRYAKAERQKAYMRGATRYAIA